MTKIKAKVTTKISAQEKIAQTLKEQAVTGPATPATGAVPAQEMPPPITEPAPQTAPSQGATAPVTPPQPSTAQSSEPLTGPSAAEAGQPATPQPAQEQPRAPAPVSPDTEKNQEAAEKAMGDNKPGAAKPAEPASKTAAGEKSKNAAGGKSGKGGAAIAAAEAAKSGDVKEAGKQALKKVVTEAIKKALAAAAKYVVGLFGWPCLIIAIIIVIIIAVMALALFASSSDGSLGGKSTPTPSGKDYPGVKTVLDAAKLGAKNSEGDGVSGYNLLGLNSTDQKAIADGLIDKRLLDALAYLSQRHLSLGFSHLVSDYQNMKGESGANAQLQSNVSAHQEGLAADISSIDFVYKVLEYKDYCLGATDFDIVYYGDQGAKIGTAGTNTSTNPAPGDTSASTGEIEASQAEADAQAEAIDQILEEIQDTLDNKCAGSTNPKIVELKQKVTELRAKTSDFKNKLDEALKAFKSLQTGLNTATGLIQAAGQNVPSEFNEINRYLTLVITNLETVNRTLASVIPVLQTATGEISQAVSENCAQVDEATAQTASGQFDQVAESINGLPDLPAVNVLSALKPVAEAIATELQKIVAETVAEQLPGVIEDIAPGLGTLGTTLTGGSQELLRLYCLGKFGDANANTTFKGQAAEAIPIKVEWQDNKPNAQYIAADAKNDCLTHEPILGPLVCYTVFRPEAQRKVHQVISELLQYPYDMGNKYNYRLRQIITFSYARDVKPFWDKLKDLYGLPRGENIGLFQMPEAWAQVHIAY